MPALIKPSMMIKLLTLRDDVETALIRRQGKRRSQKIIAIGVAGKPNSPASTGRSQTVGIQLNELNDIHTSQHKLVIKADSQQRHLKIFVYCAKPRGFKPVLFDIGANLLKKVSIMTLIRYERFGNLLGSLNYGHRCHVDGSEQALEESPRGETIFTPLPAFIRTSRRASNASRGMAKIAALTKDPNVKAVGETGLDFFRDFSPRDQQIDAFERHIELAIDTGLPMFLHERDAYPEFYEQIARHRSELSDLVVHCFTGAEEALDAYIDLGCHIGITGWICDERRGQHLLPLVKKIPKTNS